MLELDEQRRQDRARVLTTAELCHVSYRPMTAETVEAKVWAEACSSVVLGAESCTLVLLKVMRPTGGRILSIVPI